MADLGFIETIEEDEDVLVEEESTDSDEEVSKLFSSIISCANMCTYLIFVSLKER